MKSVALGYKVVFMAKTCCQMIRNGNDSDWSGSGGGGGGGQILHINVPGLFTLDIMLPTLSENECF